VQNETVYDRIRQAATGLTQAARRVAGKPAPKPPRRRRGLLLSRVFGLILRENHPTGRLPVVRAMDSTARRIASRSSSRVSSSALVQR
jgi:hypothetical protein